MCGGGGGNKTFRFVQPGSNSHAVKKPKTAKMLPFSLISRSTRPDLFCLMFTPESIQSKWFNLSVTVIFFIHSEPGRCK